MKRTYLDTGVLIAAARGGIEQAKAAFKVLDDPDRRFVSSEFLKLELMPKPTYHARRAEIQFYEAFFNCVAEWASDVKTVTSTAMDVACKHGLSAMDSLHVSAAIHLGADELFTSEAPNKPLFRVDEIRVISIQPAVNGAR